VRVARVSVAYVRGSRGRVVRLRRADRRAGPGASFAAGLTARRGTSA
jgi:hypothetical protein